MKKTSKFVAFVLLVSMLIATYPNKAFADSSIRKTFSVVVNGAEACKIPALEVNYDENVFISIKGIAYSLRDTSKQFSVSIDGEEINIHSGQAYDNYPSNWTENELSDRPKWKLKRAPVYLDEAEKRYYSLVGSVGEDGTTDAFFSPLRLAMALNLNMSVEDNTIYINTDEDFFVSDVQLENSGYLQGINALLIGDGSTGDIYYSHNGDKVVPIASTTKLMTYFVLMDAVSNGEVSLDDYANISDEARQLSEGIDGLVSFDGISAVPVSELVYGMLLPSCNECALAIAEHVSGTEKEFVDRMNNKANELQLENAMFYNSNGLPVYEKQLLPAKMQNHMSAEDMFKMASALVDTYPQVFDITSETAKNLSTLHYEAKNTNALLYNLDRVRGLKTGTTNKSGACLVSAMPIEKDGETHNLICVLFGAEGEFDRAMVAELGLRIAETKLQGAEPTVVEEKYEITKDNPEIDVERMLRNLKY